MEEKKITPEEASTIKNVLLRLGCYHLLHGEVVDNALLLSHRAFFTSQPPVVAFLSEVANKVGKGELKENIASFLVELSKVNETLYAACENMPQLFHVDHFLYELHSTLENE